MKILKPCYYCIWRYGPIIDLLAPAEALWRLADGANVMVLLPLPSMCCFYYAVAAGKCVVATAAVTTVISASSIAAKLYYTPKPSPWVYKQRRKARR